MPLQESMFIGHDTFAGVSTITGRTIDILLFAKTRSENAVDPAISRAMNNSTAKWEELDCDGELFSHRRRLRAVNV